MKQVVCRGIVLLLGLVILNSCAQKTPNEIKWASSLEDAFKIASEKDQPIIAEFWSERCSWCERLEDSTFTHQSVIDLSTNMVFVRAEAKKDTILRERYKIAGFPTVILMNNSGEEIDRIYGYVPPDKFVTIIQDYLQGKNTLEDLEKRFEADPKDAELAFQLAEKFEGRQMYEEASSYYNKVVDLDPEDEKGNSDDALFGLAWMELRKKEYLKAMDAFKYFLQKFPESRMVADAEIYIPGCYAKAGDTTKALELYEKFLTEHPDSPDTGWVKDKIKELEGSTSTD
jgi:thioredoxin-related protein